jgi:hypothetical protein
MPSLSNRALLCQLEVFAADNAIRRGILLTTTNNQSPNNAISDVSTTIQPTSSISLSPLAENSMTILRATGGPVNVTIKFGDPANAANLTAVSFDISNVFMLSTQIAALTIANNNTSSVQVRVIQV